MGTREREQESKEGINLQNKKYIFSKYTYTFCGIAYFIIIVIVIL